MGCVNLSSAVNVQTNFLKIFHMTKRDFFSTQLPSKGSINIVKLLSLGLKQSFGPFNLLPLEGSSETGLFKHLSNHLFPSL